MRELVTEILRQTANPYPAPRFNLRDEANDQHAVGGSCPNMFQPLPCTPDRLRGRAARTTTIHGRLNFHLGQPPSTRAALLQSPELCKFKVIVC